MKLANRRMGLGSISLSPSPLVNQIANAIVQMEGYNPNFAGNNNPGNLVYIGQPNSTLGSGGFAKFDTLADGQQALVNQVQYQVNQGQSLTQFFNQYAPGGTTNAAGGVQTSAATQNYINFVSNQIGVDPNVPLNSIDNSSSDNNSSSDVTNGSSNYLTDSLSLLNVNQITTDAAAVTDALVTGDFIAAGGILGTDAVLSAGVIGLGLLIAYWVGHK